MAHPMMLVNREVDSLEDVNGCHGCFCRVDIDIHLWINE